MSPGSIGCAAHFVSVAAFNAHRVGRHAITAGPHRRRCLSPDEMVAALWVHGSRGWIHPKGLRDRGQMAATRVRRADRKAPDAGVAA